MSTPSTPKATVNPVHGDRSIPSTMQAAVARRYGTAEQISVEEIPVPQPSPGEVLVRVEASSVNALDWHFLTGTPYLLRLMEGVRRPKRIVHGADVAGTVVALGDGVTDLAIGDAVFGEGSGGGCSHYLTIEPDHVALIPQGVSFESAAATPVAGLTAIQALRTHAKVESGEHVLINGAAGGVGTFAVQVAKALGAQVTAVCSTRNVDMVRRLGADHVVDYTVADFVSDGPRFDVMMDNVGNRSPRACLGVLHPGARFVAISGPKSNRWLGPVPHIARMALAVRRADASFHQFTASANRADLELLGQMLGDGRIVPEIQRAVGLSGVADALAEIGSGHARAKIVIKPD